MGNMSHKSAEVLAEFISKSGIKKGAFAKFIGVSRATLSKYLNGHGIKEKIAHRVEKFSNSKVKAQDLIE